MKYDDIILVSLCTLEYEYTVCNVIIYRDLLAALAYMLCNSTQEIVIRDKLLQEVKIIWDYTLTYTPLPMIAIYDKLLENVE